MTGVEGAPNTAEDEQSTAARVHAETTSRERDMPADFLTRSPAATCGATSGVSACVYGEYRRLPYDTIDPILPAATSGLGAARSLSPEGIVRATRRRIALGLALICALMFPLPARALESPPSAVTLPSPSVPAPPDSGSPSSTAPGSAHIGPQVQTIPPGLDEATKKALELEDQIELAQQDTIALEQRIAVVNARILGQENVLDEARLELDRSRARFEERVVEMYKSGLSNPFVLLLSARSLADFYARALMLSRVIAEDVKSYRDAELASREAEFVASVLDDMKSQLVILRTLYDARLAQTTRALADERALIATLSAASQRLVAERRAASKRSRKEWRDGSIPVGTPIGFASSIVDSTGEVYLVSDYQPLRYTTLGQLFSVVCSWYGNEFNGRPTASGQIFNQDDLTCASRTLPFGTRLALSRGARRIIVVVNDRGPFVSGRDLDLSRAAARALGFSGVERVDAVYVKPSTKVTMAP